MLKLFTRISHAWQASPRYGPAGGSPAEANPPSWSTSLLDPLPLADGNEDAEWDQWESSRMGLDSRLQALTPSGEIHGRIKPGAFDGLRILSRLGRKRTT